MTKEEFHNLSLSYSKDSIFYKDEHIMNVWEKDAIQCQAKSILESHHPKSLLEIGYGMGFTAEIFRIVPHHLIVEANHNIAEIARKKGYNVWEGFIQDFKSDEQWDVIYDDRHELVYPTDDISFLTNIKYLNYYTLNLCKHPYHYPLKTENS